MAEGETRVSCPKCGSAAFGATKTNIPHSEEFKVYVRVKCLNCGSEFDLVEKNL